MYRVVTFAAVLAGCGEPPAPVDETAPVPRPIEVARSCILAPAMHRDRQGSDEVEVAALCSIAAVDGPYEVQVQAAERQVWEVLRFGQERGLRVSVSAGGTSQGGHTHHPTGLVVDVSAMRGVVVDGDVVHALAGSTFGDVEEALRAAGSDRGVSVRPVGDAATVGGWLSTNGFSAASRCSTVSCSVVSFRVMQWDGRVVDARRDAEAGSPSWVLYRHAIGGYGLFGVIIDASLQLDPGWVTETRTQTMARREVGSWLHGAVAEDGLLAHAATITVQLDGSLGDAEAVRVVRAVGGTPGVPVSPPISAPGALQQAYFVPPEGVEGFLAALEAAAQATGVALRGVVLRHVAADDRVALSYAPEARVAIQLGFDAPGDLAVGQRFTRRVAQAAVDAGGAYHLAYQRWPSREQLVAAYPTFEAVADLKRRLDPYGRFSNRFWKEYAR